MEYPKTLYVREEDTYPYYGLKQMIGRRGLESTVPDNGQENEVAVYQLVSVGRYKKTVTRNAVVDEVK